MTETILIKLFFPLILFLLLKLFFLFVDFLSRIRVFFFSIIPLCQKTGIMSPSILNLEINEIEKKATLMASIG